MEGIIVLVSTKYQEWKKKLSKNKNYVFIERITISFLDEVKNKIYLIIFDLENSVCLSEQMLKVKEVSTYYIVSLLGFQVTPDPYKAGKFLAFGGDRIISDPHFSKVIQNLKAVKKENNNEDEPPAKWDIQTGSYRLAEYLHLQNQIKLMMISSKETTLLQTRTGRILETVFTLIQPHIAVLLVNNSQQVESYVKTSEFLFKEDYKDFKNFCLNDFFSYFQSLNLEDINEFFYLGNRNDFEKIKISREKISSYFYIPLYNGRKKVEATLHLGHLRNNYFSEKMIEHTQSFVLASSGSFYYALRLHQITLKQEKLFNIFGRFVPQEIIPELIMRETEKESSAVEEREIVVLFSDIRSFTTITEKNGAQDVVDFLNRHFEVMVKIIKKHGGSIDKFIGDAIVAMFGVPVNHENNAERAMKAAIEMSQALKTVDCSKLVIDGDHYSIGIGLHKGPAIIGNVGSREKADYTAIGDVIGIAEELEAMTKKYKVLVLASEKVKEYSGEISTKMKFVDDVTLGKTGQIKLFTPMVT